MSSLRRWPATRTTSVWRMVRRSTSLTFATPIAAPRNALGLILRPSTLIHRFATRQVPAGRRARVGPQGPAARRPPPAGLPASGGRRELVELRPPGERSEPAARGEGRELVELRPPGERSEPAAPADR